MNRYAAIAALATLLLAASFLSGCAATRSQARDETACQQAATAECASRQCAEGDEAWEDLVRDCMEQKGYLY